MKSGADARGPPVGGLVVSGIWGSGIWDSGKTCSTKRGPGLNEGGLGIREFRPVLTEGRACCCCGSKEEFSDGLCTWRRWRVFVEDRGG